MFFAGRRGYHEAAQHPVGNLYIPLEEHPFTRVYHVSSILAVVPFIRSGKAPSIL
jgi:hypothetical protein